MSVVPLVVWLLLGAVGIVCLAVGVWLEHRERRRNQDRTTGKRPGRIRTGE